MLSYQHGFHAGNRADLHKHGTLVWLLTQLARKDKPASFLDVYAGRGLYDLASEAARKTGEAEQGILKAYGRAWPEALAPWKALLAGLNPKGVLRSYGGSPWLAAKLLRPTDKLTFCDLHPQEFNKLEEVFKKDSRIGLHFRHAHEALLALLPPTPRRGLVLIDPSFEVKSEFVELAEVLVQAVGKWQTGQFMLWYPLLPGDPHRPMLRKLAELQLPQLVGEWRWRETWHEDTHGMLGSGILLINPPWQTDAFLKEWQDTLRNCFSPGQARLEWVHEAS